MLAIFVLFDSTDSRSFCGPDPGRDIAVPCVLVHGNGVLDLSRIPVMTASKECNECMPSLAWM